MEDIKGFNTALTLLSVAREKMIDYITSVVKEHKQYDLEHLPLAYNEGEQIHTLYADGAFYDEEDDYVKIGVVFYDENGDIDGTNDELSLMSTNELYDIMTFIHSKEENGSTRN